MTPKNHIVFVSLIIAGTCLFEMSLLAGLEAVADPGYQLVHLCSMGLLIAGQVLLIRHFRQNGLPVRFPALTAAALVCTGIGDLVNGTLTGITPVSTKLTFALFLFGAGYLIYTYNLWQAIRITGAPSRKMPLTLLMFLIAGALINNLSSWFIYIDELVQGFTLLRYGGMIFNATIYVAMPVLGIYYAYKTGWAISGWIILIAGVFLPYSDLILFDSWLPGNPDFPGRDLYAYNWMVYFSGQCLMSMLPSFLAHGGGKETE
jgi:hypothetical protein